MIIQLITIKKNIKNEDMIAIQMNDLSSYLPPLDPLNCKPMKLDDWQLEVFNLIENKKIFYCVHLHQLVKLLFHHIVQF